MGTLFLLGRAIFGGVLVYNGLTELRNLQGTAPGPERATPSWSVVRASGLLLVAGGASVIAGVRPRHGLATLVAFLVPATLRTHRFWDEADPHRRTSEMVRFATNMALAGAGLALMQIAEPWPASLDARRAGTDEEMFVHMGGRNLRALPV